jgi:hypothetical protein
MGFISRPVSRIRDVTLWFYTDEVDSLYELLAEAAAEPTGGHSIEFVGYTLVFLKEDS